MKRIYLLRHGKSDWSAAYDHDRQRPLAPRGRAAARLMGRFLARVGQIPDAVVTSPAVRARRTAELAAEAGAWGCPVEIAPRLYGGSATDGLQLIQAQGEDRSRLLLVGHQPTWSELLAALVGGGEIKLVTASLVRVDVPAERWSRLEPGGAILAWLLTPKLLQRGLHPEASGQA